MKLTKTIATALLASTIAGSAFAADLPSRKAPMLVAPAPMLTWNGFYIGVNVGGTFGGNGGTSVVGVPGGTGGGFFAGGNAVNDVALTGTAGNSSKAGFIGGGQIGYNAQFGSMVAGIEADIQGVAASNGAANLQGISVFNAINSSVVNHTITNKLTYLGTVRGRLGFLATPSFLLYATGGLAYGGVKSTSSISEIFTGGAPLTGSSLLTASTTRVGWTIGAGAEWMFAANWSAKLEYMYYDLGSFSYSNPILIANTGTGFSALDYAQIRVRNNGHIVRAGLNYHFNFGGPSAVVAKY